MSADQKAEIDGAPRDLACAASMLYDEVLDDVHAEPIGSLARRLHTALGDLAHAVIVQPAAPPMAHGKAWEDRLNIICLCGKVCSAVVRKNPAGGFIGRPGSDTYVDPPAAQVFANHLWEMNHPPVDRLIPPGASS